MGKQTKNSEHVWRGPSLLTLLRKFPEIGSDRAPQMDPSFYLLDSACNNHSRPTVIDLFSGAGGLTLGFQAAGFDVVLASDISKPCARTHTLNLPEVPFMLADIGAISGRDILRR